MGKAGDDWLGIDQPTPPPQPKPWELAGYNSEDEWKKARDEEKKAAEEARKKQEEALRIQNELAAQELALRQQQYEEEKRLREEEERKRKEEEDRIKAQAEERLKRVQRLKAGTLLTSGRGATGSAPVSRRSLLGG